MVDLRETASAASRTIGLSFSRTSKAYSIDDELLLKFSKNVKAAIPAFQFLTSQSNRIAQKCWPRFFKSLKKVVLLLLELLGELALQFDGIDLMFNEFDTLQATSIFMTVHPKDRQFAIPSMQLELENYRIVLEHLEVQIVTLARYHAQQLKQRIDEIVSRLKECRKNISNRERLGNQAAKLEKKARALSERGLSLDVQKRAELAGLEASLEITRAAYDTESSNLKLVLPEFLSLVEEFTEVVSKWTLAFHHLQIQEVKNALNYIVVFHGFTYPKLNDGKDDYSAIIEKWEGDVTATRVKLESFLLIIYDKNPDRLDEDINDKDGSLKASKFWSLVTQKVRNKLHKIKVEDYQHGIFDKDITADPLISFAKYQDSHANLLQSYHPSRILDVDEVHISEKITQAPPALPPRDNTREIFLSPRAEYQSPKFRTEFELPGLGVRNKSLDSLSSTSSGSGFLSSNNDSDDSASQSDILGKIPDGNKAERSTQQLLRQYNYAKNDITQCPILPSKYESAEFSRKEFTGAQTHNTVTFEMYRLHNFFVEALASIENDKFVVAKKDFKGLQPGDLSFKRGDKIIVVQSLQDDVITYNEDGENWFVGATTDHKESQRVGFAPSTYFGI